jgi:hypothetical protein
MLSRFCPESDNDIPGMTLDSIGGYYDLNMGDLPPQTGGRNGNR